MSKMEDKIFKSYKIVYSDRYNTKEDICAHALWEIAIALGRISDQLEELNKKNADDTDNRDEE